MPPEALAQGVTTDPTLTPYTGFIPKQPTHANRSPLPDPLQRLRVALSVVPHAR